MRGECCKSLMCVEKELLPGVINLFGFIVLTITCKKQVEKSSLMAKFGEGEDRWRNVFSGLAWVWYQHRYLLLSIIILHFIDRYSCLLS